uniref:Uncharacterized protein n=1 Tax=Electrophorus electricus TaxID=8005 RepID=A0A4W4G0L8_ELEEL
MDRMKKIKRQLSLTLRGNSSEDKRLNDTMGSQDAGAHSDSGTVTARPSKPQLKMSLGEYRTLISAFFFSSLVQLGAYSAMHLS